MISIFTTLCFTPGPSFGAAFSLFWGTIFFLLGLRPALTAVDYRVQGLPFLFLTTSSIMLTLFPLWQGILFNTIASGLRTHVRC